MTDLFGTVDLSAVAPLAEQIRPNRLEDVLGQDHLLGANGPLARMTKAKRLSSIVFWGAPGSGKTTIARLLAAAVGMRFVATSAVTTTISELKQIFAEASMQALSGQKTVLFVDEVHRMTRAVQDQLLGPIESGILTLIACTTEHPAYQLTNALNSRCSVLILNKLQSDDLRILLDRAEAHVGRSLPVTADAREALIATAHGDGRYLLNQAETLLALETDEQLDADQLRQVLGTRLAQSDKDREFHYDLASAFQKSVRGSDPDAALYWFARMLEGGEDMKFILRRLTIMASEEVAVADPQALVQCVAARQAYEALGSPEGEYAVAQAIVYVATAPKSNAVYEAYGAARALAKRSLDLYPPERIINHPTPALARQRGYRYDHDCDGAFSGQSYWPDELGRHTFYCPNPRGYEAQIAKRLEHWGSLRDPAPPQG